MAHFFIRAGQKTADRITISGADHNHLKNVLRMRIGEAVTVSDDAGRTFACEVTAFGAEETELRILEEKEESAELFTKIMLFQGLPKGDKMELIIKMAVELGVYEIVPVAMKRCVVQLDDKKAGAKVKRYQAVSESAAKQSGRDLIPEVHAVVNWKEALKLAAENGCRMLVPYEKAGEEEPESAGTGAQETLSASAQTPETPMAYTRRILQEAAKAERVAVFIGPEGGFEPAEIREAEEKGAEIISLGRRILRTETAGPAVLSMLMLFAEA